MAITSVLDANRNAPAGSIIPWIGGYFTNGSNASFTNVIGNTVANVNALLNASGWYVCDGAALNDSASPIFNGAGRYLPNLTDERFLQGSTTAGGIGGSNTLIDHTHTFSLTMAHNHSIEHDHASFSTTDGAGAHYHVGAHAAQGFDRYGTENTGINSDRSEQGAAWSSTIGNKTSTAGGHNHTIDVPNFTGNSGPASNSTVAGSVGAGSAATSTNARPKYLSVFYIMKVK